MVRFSLVNQDGGGLWCTFEFLERDIVPHFVTPHGIWPQHDLRVRFSNLEGRKAIEEAEGLHPGLLSSRDAVYLYYLFGLCSGLSWVNEIRLSRLS